MISSVSYVAYTYVKNRRHNAIVFNSAWGIVKKNHFDQSFNGFDWNAVRKNYEKKAISAHNNEELYSTAIIPMLDLLGSSHTQAFPPSELRNGMTTEIAINPVGNSFPSDMFKSAGIYLSPPSAYIKDRVISIQKNSYLYNKGVRPSWVINEITSLPNKSGEFEQVTVSFLKLDGNLIILKFNLALKKSANYEKGWTKKSIGSYYIHDLNAIRSGILEHNLVEDNGSSIIKVIPLGISYSKNISSYKPIRVIDIKGGSSAEKAGVEPGSFVYDMSDIKIKGKIRELNLKTDYKNRINNYKIKYNYNNYSDKVILTSKKYKKNTWVFRFDHFNNESANWLKNEIIEKNPDHIILDLRNNIGGSISSLNKILGYFLNRGDLIGYTKKLDKINEMKIESNMNIYNGDISVLVGPASASSAEVAAIALRYNLNSKLIGLQTSGSTITSATTKLPDLGILQIAIAEYLGPQKQRIEGVGIKPDIEVWPTLKTIRAGRDAAIDSAIENCKCYR
jgi:C-terminal processing protease CtpA/Prc